MTTNISFAIRVYMDSTRKYLLTSHVQHCKVESAQRTKISVDDPTLKFTNVQKQLNVHNSQCMQTSNASFNSTSKMTVQMSIRKHISRKSHGIATLRYFKNTLPCSFAFKVTYIDPDEEEQFSQDESCQSVANRPEITIMF